MGLANSFGSIALSDPGGGRSVFISALALTPVRFSLPSFFRWLQRLLFPPLNDDQDDLTYDEIYAAWDVRQLEHQYSVQHLERCFKQRTVDPPRT